MARTTPTAVQAVLAAGQDYDVDAAPDLTPYIDAANATTSRVSECASMKGIGLSASELEIIERWLSAYYYTRSDPIYQSKTTGGQSASFVADSQASTERYKAGAMAVDASGCVKAILNGVGRPRAVWLGKTQSEQTSWTDRN